MDTGIPALPRSPPRPADTTISTLHASRLLATDQQPDPNLIATTYGMSAEGVLAYFADCGDPSCSRICGIQAVAVHTFARISRLPIRTVERHLAAVALDDKFVESLALGGAQDRSGTY